MADRDRGLYNKFIVSRSDGRDAPGEKHHKCRYFVLDITHDPHARVALQAYMESAGKDGFGLLVDDLDSALSEVEEVQDKV